MFQSSHLIGFGATNAAPIFVSQTINNGGPATSNVTVNMPASVVSGNLLIAAAFNRGNKTYTWPAGWNKLMDAGSTPGLSIAWRRADGTEGASITVTVSSSGERWCAACLQFSNWIGTPQVGTTASGSSTTPDPPSVTPSWGDSASLAVAIMSSSAGSNATGYPSGYSNGQTTATSGITAATATKQNSTSPEDPATFTVASAAWNAQTVIILGG